MMGFWVSWVLLDRVGLCAFVGSLGMEKNSVRVKLNTAPRRSLKVAVEYIVYEREREIERQQWGLK